MMEVTGIILTGGKNLRFGRVKTLEKIGGVTIFERVVKRLEPIVNHFVVVTAIGKTELPPIVEARFVSDIYPGMGPLGGIYTGLVASHTETNIVVACDMPFLSTSFLSYMVDLSPDFDAVIPRSPNGFIEPLHAVYSQSCKPSMQKQLENKQLSIRQVFEEVKVRYVDEEEYRKFDPELLSFLNINRQSDLDLAMKIAEQK
jgi:molybdopterin-guanine dinucleotide biosynthesis protein A